MVAAYLRNLTILERLLVPVDEVEVALRAFPLGHTEHALNFGRSFERACIDRVSTANRSQAIPFRGTKVLNYHILQVVVLLFFILLLLGRVARRIGRGSGHGVVAREFVGLTQVSGWIAHPAWVAPPREAGTCLFCLLTQLI